MIAYDNGGKHWKPVFLGGGEQDREIGPNKNLNKTENPDNKENHEKTKKKEWKDTIFI